MDLDGSLSTEVAIIAKKQDYDDIVTMGLALSNDGKPVPSVAGSFCGLIPKGAKNVAVAKDFLKYLIQPAVLNEYLKTGLGRREPPMPSIVKKDPWWLDPKDQHRVAYTTGRAEPDQAAFLGLQPGLGASRERACLAGGLGQNHDGRGGGSDRGGKGVQARRGGFRKIPDRPKLS
jgi:multiple sugar transport system substrate-binding protein